MQNNLIQYIQYVPIYFEVDINVDILMIYFNNLDIKQLKIYSG